MAEEGTRASERLLLRLTGGVAVARTRIVARWVGWAAVLGGLLYMAVGVAVGYSGFEKPGGLAIQLLSLIFVVGVLVGGVRTEQPVAQ